MSPPVAPLDAALQHIREGDPLRAEEIVAAAVEEARSTHGETSLAYVRALNELAQVLVILGDLGRAIGQLSLATEVPPEGEEATREHLTATMNLGELLLHRGALDDADRVLRKGLVEREAFYGRDHPGLAFGQEPLVQVLLLKGSAVEALEMASAALTNLWDNGHERVASMLGLYATALAAADSVAPDDWIPRLEQLPAELIDEAIGALLRRVDTLPGGPLLEVLDQLLDYVQAQFGDLDPRRLQTLAAITNVARREKDHARRISAFSQLKEQFALLDDRANEVQAEQGLALAFGDAGDVVAAEEAYRSCVARSVSLGPEEHANALRNFGLWLGGVDRGDEGLSILTEAVEIARHDGGVALGRALVAAGIGRQHGGDLEGARAMLAEAIDLLPADEPDALPARSHLSAIDTDRSCGCGEIGGAFSEALREMVLPQLPEGLLDQLAYEPGDDGELALSVSLARQPTEEEMAHLDRVIRQAVATLQQRIRDQGASRS